MTSIKLTSAFALLMAVLASLLPGGVYMVQSSQQTALEGEVDTLRTELSASGSDGQAIGEQLDAMTDEATALEKRLATANRRGVKAVEADLVELRNCFTEVASQVESGFDVQYGYASPSTGLSGPCSSYVYPDAQVEGE